MDRRALNAAAVALSVFLSGFLPGQARAGDPLEAMGGLRPTAISPAPEVTFATLDGRDVRVQDLRGKPILLGFFTTW